MNKSQWLHGHQMNLMATFDFTQKELRLNQHGELSQRQLDYLRKDTSNMLIAGLAIGIVVLILFLPSAILYFSFVAVFFCTTALAFIMAMLTLYRYERRMVATAHASETRGIAMIEMSILTIDGVRFVLPPHKLSRIQPLHLYRVYYLREKKHILSIEPIPIT